MLRFEKYTRDRYRYSETLNFMFQRKQYPSKVYYADKANSGGSGLGISGWSGSNRRRSDKLTKEGNAVNAQGGT